MMPTEYGVGGGLGQAPESICTLLEKRLFSGAGDRTDTTESFSS